MSGNDSARSFLDSLVGYTADAQGDGAGKSQQVKLGVVDPAYTGGAARVKFDGETVMGTRTYVALQSVAANDRVVLLPVGRTYAILGSVAGPAAPEWGDLVGEIPGTKLPGRLQAVIPSSVVVGSGSASVDADGLVTFTGVSSLSLNGVFDGLGGDMYELVLDTVTSSGTLMTTRLRAAGVDDSGTVYDYTINYVKTGGVPSRYSGTINYFGTWSPSTAGTGNRISGRMLFAGAGKASHVSNMMSQISSKINGEVWVLNESAFGPSTVFDGFSILAPVGTITGTAKVVKLA